MRISDSLVPAYAVLDYVPIVSTLTNLNDLFHIKVRKEELETAKSHYYIHLRSKSELRCFILLIPVLGNIIVAIYDLAKKRARASLLVDLDHNPNVLRSHKGIAFDAAFIDDKEIVMKAIKRDPESFKVTSIRLRDDKDVVLFALKKDPNLILYVSQRLRKEDEDVAHVILSHRPEHFILLGKRLQKSEKLAHVSLENKINFHTAKCIISNFNSNKKVAIKCLKSFDIPDDATHAELLNHLDPELQNDAEIVHEFSCSRKRTY